MKKKICTSAFITVLMCASLFAGGPKDKNDNPSTIHHNNNTVMDEIEYKNETTSNKAVLAKLTWDEEVALIEAEGNIVLSEEEYPEKIVEWLSTEGEKITKMARRPDKSLIFHSIDKEKVEWLYLTDKNENTIHALTSNNLEWWKDYDSFGNEIHFLRSDGYESWRVYDSYGNVIYYQNNDRTEYWYDSSGNAIHYRYSYWNDWNEWWKDYDANGNEIHYRNNDGYEAWYAINGNVVRSSMSKNGVETLYDYDAKGNVIHSKSSDGYEGWYDYDERGNVISYRWITDDKRSFRETVTYDNVKVSKNSTKTRKIYSKRTKDRGKNTLEIWYTYSTDYNDADKWDERNFVTQIRVKAGGNDTWYYTINGKRVENISGEGTLRFEMLPSGKMKVTPDSGDWWIAE